jgi:hypothetical protein
MTCEGCKQYREFYVIVPAWTEDERDKSHAR